MAQLRERAEWRFVKKVCGGQYVMTCGIRPTPESSADNSTSLLMVSSHKYNPRVHCGCVYTYMHKKRPRSGLFSVLAVTDRTMYIHVYVIVGTCNSESGCY